MIVTTAKLRYFLVLLAGFGFGNCALLEIGDEGYECKVRFVSILRYQQAKDNVTPWLTTSGDFRFSDIPKATTFPENGCKNKVFESFESVETCSSKISGVLYSACNAINNPTFIIGNVVNNQAVLPADGDYTTKDGSGNTYNFYYRNGVRTYTLDFLAKTLTLDGEFYLKNNESNCVTSNCDANR